MKILCFTNSNCLDRSVVSLLENEGYETKSVKSSKELSQEICENYFNRSIVVYQISNDNFNNCYKSLSQVRKLQANMFLNPYILVIVSQNLTSYHTEKLNNLSEDVLAGPLNHELLLSKIGSYTSSNISKIPCNDNEDKKISELLYVMKNQLISIRNTLSCGSLLENDEVKIVADLQTQLLQLSRYLTKGNKIFDTTFINVGNLLRKIFANYGWNEINHYYNFSINTVEANYEYFARAMEDLIEKLIRIAGSQDKLTIQEIVNKDYLIINFTIKNIQPEQPQNLLDYKNFDFCQKVLNLNAGDFFIKFDNNLAYITCRLPIAA